MWCSVNPPMVLMAMLDSFSSVKRRVNHRPAYSASMIDPTPDRRFPRPWRVRESGESFIVEDANGFPVAFIYFEDEKSRADVSHRMNRYQAERIALGDRKNWLNPRYLMKDIA